MRRMNGSPCKTLHLTNNYHGTSGGIRTLYNAMLGEAERTQRRMVLVVPGESTRMEQLGEFTRIYQVAGLRSPVFDPRYRFLLPHGYMVPYAGAIWKILKEEDPDLVEVCDKYALIWLAGLLRKRMLPGLKRPSLVGFSCERMDDNISAYLGNGEFGRRFARYYMGWCYIPFFDVHIVNSAYTADELQRAMVPKHRRPVWVCPMGVDRTSNAGASNGDARSELMQKIGAHPNSRLLFYAGRLSPEKNLELLLDTMDLLVDQGGDYHMILAGDGPRAEWLREKGLARLPGRVHCLGHVSNREELLLLYRSCDAFVHPNPREPFGIAPLEALAFGLPLVAPNSGGVLAYADETNAWLTDPDPAAFSTAILSVFMDPDSRERKVAAGLQTAAQHEWPAVTRELFGIYDKAAFSFKEKARA